MKPKMTIMQRAALAILLLPSLVLAELSALNFRDVEITTAVESIAAITGKTFVVDPRVKGRISIVSTEPVDSDAVYDIFLSSLMAQGYQAVSDGKTVQILPAAKAANTSNRLGSNEFVTEVITVDSDSGDQYAGIIKPLLGPGGVVSYNKSSGSLVISDSRVQLDRFRNIINDLESAASREFDVIDLAFLSAKEFVDIAKQSGLLDQRTTVVEDTFQNRIIIFGSAITRYKIKELLAQLDVSEKESINSGLDVIFLNYADAVSIQPIVDALVRSMLGKDELKPKDKGAVDNAPLSIQADEKNNAIIVVGTKKIIDMVQSVITKLDRPRSQVLIEAVIAEVSEEFFKELNVNLAAVGDSGAFLADFNGVLSAAAAAAVSGDSADKASALNSLQATPSFGAVGNQGNNRGIATLIQAIRTDTKNTLLSTPSILTLDNEEATISIGKEVPFVTGSYSNASNGGTNPFQTIERKEVGTILKVKPQVSENDAIRLKIVQEVSNIDPTSVGGAGDTNFTTDKKMIETNVVVNENQTLVLGGLIDRKFSLIEKKVPLLGDLPLLGNLFRSKQRAQDTTVLMVFIRPTLIKDRVTADQLTDKKYQVLHGRYEDFLSRQKGKSWLPAFIDSAIGNGDGLDQLPSRIDEGAFQK